MVILSTGSDVGSSSDSDVSEPEDNEVEVDVADVTKFDNLNFDFQVLVSHFSFFIGHSSMLKSK